MGQYRIFVLKLSFMFQFYKHRGSVALAIKIQNSMANHFIRQPAIPFLAPTFQISEKYTSLSKCYSQGEDGIHAVFILFNLPLDKVTNGYEHKCFHH